MNESEQTNGNGEITRLPLWKACLDEMLAADAVHFGAIFKAEFFEVRLKCQRDSMQFGLGISEIRRALEFKGFYLSGRGQGGSQYVVLPPEENQRVAGCYERDASDSLKRAVTLLVHTDTKTLSDEQKRRHELRLEKIGIKAALISRWRALSKVLTQMPSRQISDGEKET